MIDTSVLLPSQTSDGKQWLDNFADSDRGTAARLADSLDVIDHTDALAALQQYLKSRLEDPSADYPILVVPIRSQEDIGPSPSGTAGHVAYETFDPGEKAPIFGGSESDIGGALRDIVQNSDERLLAPTASLEELKTRRVKSILLVTDYAGSGNQALRFAQTFRSNSTIGSWMSYGRLSIEIFSYATSVDASLKLKAIPWLKLTTVATAKSAVSSSWAPSVRDSIRQLCLDYADVSNEYPPLGYKSSFGLYLTNFRVPNNLPQVFLRDTPNWYGLFPARTVRTTFRAQLPAYHPRQSLTQALIDVGAPELAAELQRATRPLRATRALATLQLADYGFDPAQIDFLLDLDQETRERLRGSLVSLGLVDVEGSITRRGRAELREFRRRGVKWSNNTLRDNRAASNAVEYTPTQLR